MINLDSIGLFIWVDFFFFAMVHLVCLHWFIWKILIFFLAHFLYIEPKLSTPTGFLAAPQYCSLPGPPYANILAPPVPQVCSRLPLLDILPVHFTAISEKILPVNTPCSQTVNKESFVQHLLPEPQFWSAFWNQNA